MDTRVVDCPKMGAEKRIEAALALLRLHPEDLAFMHHAVTRAVFAINGVKDGIHYTPCPKGQHCVVISGLGEEAVTILGKLMKHIPDHEERESL